MKRYLISILAILLFIGTTQAQLVKQQAQTQKKQTDLDWYNCSFEKDGVYGAEVNRAIEFLKDKKLRKRPIVAFIGGGIDVEHEDLKEVLWTNPKEKADGKDRDKNGLVDDVHGWNFLGGKDGRVMVNTLREGDREFLRLKEKYADYMFDGKQYFKIIDGKRTIVPAPEDMKEFAYYRYRVVMESLLAGAYGGIALGYIIKEYGDKFEKQMRAHFPEVKELTVKEFAICYDPKAPRDSLSEVVFTLIATGFSVMKTDKWEVVYNNFITKTVESATKRYEALLQKEGNDGRKEIVGDDVNNLKDNRYGNNILLTSDAVLTTMQAGIVAGKRGDGRGGDGIMDQAKVMSLRICGESGEPYLKDMALAIRYAVDHKADIVILPQQNTLYPPYQKTWISDAIAYAEAKGVLVIVPVWELSQDLSQITFYPNRHMQEGRELTNLMVVASADKNGNPAMAANYGAHEVDLFAPGMEIYSSYPGDTYKAGTGTGLSAATVAGVAALIKAYYPELTGTQIRQLLIDQVTSRKGVEVEKGCRVDGKNSQDLFVFEQLCVSAGIVNAYRAVVAAAELSKR